MEDKSAFSKNLKLAREARGYTQKKVAETIAVSKSSYSLYESGGREPSIKTIEKIAHALHVSIDELFGLFNFTSGNLIKESSVDYLKVACAWKEYYDLPDGENAELVNGELYYLAAPSRLHQEIVMGLSYTIMSYIKKSKGGCQVYNAPFAVKLSEEVHTIVQPDISVICNKDKLDDRGCNGGPDMVIEVISPSSRSWDMIDKLKLYKDYDVKEYWIVDPYKKCTMVYLFDNKEQMLETYSFDEFVEVGIFEGLRVKIGELLG